MLRTLLLALAIALLHTAASAAPPLRILTYNIHHGEGTDGKLDLERIAKVITEAKADLVALQEVDVKTKRTGLVDQAARLSDLTKLHVAFGRAMRFDGGEYGNAVLSRWPIAKSQVVELGHDAADRTQEPRCALLCQITPAEMPAIIFASTHFCHRSPATREAQAKALAGALDETKLPAILAGDFNARSSSKSMQILLAGGWLDTTAKISVIDYVLVRESEAWKVVEAQTIDEKVASDHQPVLSVLEWTK